jgi:hypothetical protein
MGPRNAYKDMLENVVSPNTCVSMNHQNQLEQMTNGAMFATSFQVAARQSLHVERWVVTPILAPGEVGSVTGSGLEVWNRDGNSAPRSTRPTVAHRINVHDNGALDR